MKTDNSPKIAQRDKIKSDFEIKEFKWTEKQKRFIEIGTAKETNIIFCKSPPGTGKTLLSLFCSLVLLRQKRVSEICYFRNPIESASKGLGFLSGDFEEKMFYYTAPMVDHLEELLSSFDSKALVNDGRILCLPIGFLKGRTFNVNAIILDEAEDLSLEELRLSLTRLGKRSKMFIIGDIKQSNIKNSGFEKVFNSFDNQESRNRGIFTFEFDKSDILRNDILCYIVDVFEKMR